MAEFLTQTHIIVFQRTEGWEDNMEKIGRKLRASQLKFRRLSDKQLGSNEFIVYGTREEIRAACGALLPSGMGLQPVILISDYRRAFNATWKKNDTEDEEPRSPETSRAAPRPRSRRRSTL